ncbi:MotA/TolQ/ExbB proton channel family protein [Coraliomargarita sp. SDUM461003]|uniref:MotA/TolQ/ExbB proton channel family protein n=1 Tax=Thalassobacterium maritimum TaxID=3041265 RepID=A0ABU1AQA1_9BACT|nr:MotA/TolQ/ExbB proton channel family protein [Coraliomargarita sp. SDUM461003]MDQ8206354.1 MotA/TolQ/ExbB proton channel family protein [Coraliomargarita sp. SDUM461003]
MHPKIHLLKLRTLFCALAFVGASTLAFAQTADPTAEGAAPVVETSERSFLEMVAQGGWAMYPLGFLSMSALALTVYNFIALRPKDFFNDEVASELGGKLGDLDIEGAKELCAENPTPLTRIVNHGLDSVRGGQIDTDLFRQRLEAGSGKELAQPFVVINYLSIIASISPMLGLLGTVSGMVKAFSSIATVGMGQPDLLAGNISEALITTATGMLVGIPTMFFFFFFKNKYGKLVADMTMYLDDMYGDLVHGTRVNNAEMPTAKTVRSLPPAPRKPGN